MINAILVIIGTIIGAGFASGKEIFTFFNVYGVYGLFGLIISGFVIGIVIYKTFCIIISYNITSYSDFINKTIRKSNFINTVVCNIINIFLLISFIIMVAGFSAYFAQEFNISYVWGASLIAILSFFTFLKDMNRIIKINTYFIPFLIFIILLLGIKNLDCFTFFEYNSTKTNFYWIISSLLYASYNLIIVFPILISLKPYIHSLKNAKIVSVVVAFFLILMSGILFFLLNYYFVEVYSLELPTVYIATNLGSFYKYVCSLVILGAIFTTAISSGYGFLSNINITHKKLYTCVAFFMCLISISLCNMGFTTLLNLLYPILGCLRFYTDCFYIIFYKNALKNFIFIGINM